MTDAKHLRTVPKHGLENPLHNASAADNHRPITIDDLHTLIIETLIPKIESSKLSSEVSAAKSAECCAEAKAAAIKANECAEQVHNMRREQGFMRSTLQSHGTALANHTAAVSDLRAAITDALGLAVAARHESSLARASKPGDETTTRLANLALASQEHELAQKKRASDAKWAAVGRASPVLVALLLAVLAAWLRSKGLL
jgi:hypothetical protein